MATKPNKTSYHEELDCLRFVTFAGIFIHHFLQCYFGRLEQFADGHSTMAGIAVALIDAGSSGVDMFFVLSGFLITSLLLKEMDRTGTINVPAFLLRRSLRILPLYFVFLGIAAFVLPRYIPDETIGNNHLLSFCLFAGNWSCGALGYPTSVAASLWSISLENQFYLIWPFVIPFLLPHRLFIFLLGGIGLCTVAQIGLFEKASMQHAAIWTNTLVRMCPIVCGAMYALVVHRKLWSPSIWLRRILLAAGCITLPLMQFVLGPDAYYTRKGLVLYPVVAIACTCILIGIFREHKVSCPKPIVRLGRVSYGLFVFHLLAIKICSIALPRPHDASLFDQALACGQTIVFASLLTLCLAAISYVWLEKPFLRLRTKARPARLPSGSLSEAKV